MYYDNLSQYKKLRKLLRKNQTPAEYKFWSRVRNKRFYGFKFYRQYSIGRYILDFYCPSLKLCIEVDGSQHMQKDQMLYDQERTLCLHGMGIRIVRYWNSEVLGNIDGVLEDLAKYAQARQKG